jgi:hypothetical protein
MLVLSATTRSKRTRQGIAFQDQTDSLLTSSHGQFHLNFVSYAFSGMVIQVYLLLSKVNAYPSKWKASVKDDIISDDGNESLFHDLDSGMPFDRIR